MRHQYKRDARAFSSFFPPISLSLATGHFSIPIAWRGLVRWWWSPAAIRMHQNEMAFSAALCGNLPNISNAPRPSHHCHQTFNQKQRFIAIPESQKRKNYGPLIIRPVLNKLNTDISDGNERGASEPATILLERLFAKAQKLEEFISRETSLSVDDELSMDLEVLEADLQVALTALRKKEEDLQDAERRVVLENARLNQTKKDLEQRDVEIVAACSEQKKMEEELKRANGDLTSRSRQIEDLKLLVEEQGKKIDSSQFALTLKEEEMDRLRNELMKKNEEATIMSSELRSKEQLLSEASELIKEQEAKIGELQREINEKEHDLTKSLQLREVEEERLKIEEANLEKRTVEWLSAREELKEMSKHAAKNMNDVKGSSEDFKRVRVLLADVRSELISTQESLASSRRKMEDQTVQLEKQLAELDEQKHIVISLRESLKDAQLEVENERTKLRSAHIKCKELESQLSKETKLSKQLQEEIKQEQSLLRQGAEEIALLRKELQQKELEYSDAQNLLQVKESELLEARLQIQHMKSEAAYAQLILQEKDSDLLRAQQELADVNGSFAELQRLLDSKEDQLIQATMRLQEKEEHVWSMKHELDDVNLKYCEATSLVQRIAQLTGKLVTSVKDEESIFSLDEGNLACDLEHNAKQQQKQLETELEMMKGLLEEKEMDFQAAERALVVKDEELRAVHSRWSTREKEIEKSKKELLEDANALKKLYSFAQERIGDQSVGELAIKKHQIEAGQLEAEAATSALQRLSEMTRQLVQESGTSIDSGTSVHKKPTDIGDSSNMSLDGIEDIEEAGKEVARLLALTQLLVKEAGINDT